MNWIRRTLPLLLLVALLPLAGHSVGDLDAHDWVAPLVAAPGLEIEGNPHLWQRANAKALDPVFDGATGTAARGDLMGFYFDQEVDRLSMRVNIYPTRSAEAAKRVLDPGVRVFVLMDYEPGGTTSLPEGIAGASPIAWDRAVELTESATGAAARLLDTTGDARETERVRSARATGAWDMIEASCWLPGGRRTTSMEERTGAPTMASVMP